MSARLVPILCYEQDGYGLQCETSTIALRGWQNVHCVDLQPLPQRPATFTGYYFGGRLRARVWRDRDVDFNLRLRTIEKR